MTTAYVPVIAIDGPSSSGKGTVSRIVARQLGWHFLDSGVLYRLTGLAALHHAVSLDDDKTLQALAEHLDVEFLTEGLETSRILLEGEDVTDTLRSEECSRVASQVARLPGVRQALLARQRAFREPPGLVADGRDMGTVVFRDAKLKIFLTASQEERARRRYNQLKGKGFNVNLGDLLDELAERDARDSTRSVAPTKPAPDAVVLDTTAMDIETVVAKILSLWQERCRG